MDSASVVQFIESAAAVGALARLTQLKLAGRFPALFGWLAILAATDFSFGLLPQRSALYFWIYVCSQPAANVLSILAVRELLGIVFVDYPGIRSIGRWFTYIGVALASTASLATSMLLVRDTSHVSIHLYYVEVLDRSVVFTLAVIIISVLFALSRYPLHLSRNSIVSSVFFSSIFLSDTVRLLIDSLAIRLNNRMADIAEEIVISGCLGAWAVMLSRQEVTGPAQVQQPTLVTFANPAEAQLLGELDALNRLLSRAARN
jgi:hypothetical protein